MGRDSLTFEAIPTSERIDDEDIQAAFDAWKSGLEDSESPGSVRVFRVPLDAQGNASHSAGGQVRLGTWPVDQFTFDTLCDKMVKEFMLPTESMMAVRLIGTMAGKQGVRFNKIVVLQRPNVLANPNLPKNEVSEIMRAMQEGQERMFRMIQEMKPPTTAGSPGDMQGMMQFAAMMRVMTEPMTQMMGPMMAALAGRPIPAGPAGGGIKETIETMMLMDKFMGRRGGGPSEPDWMRMTTAVAGVAKPLLELAAANQLQGTRTRKQPAQLAAPRTAGVAQPVPAPAPQSVPVQPTATPPVYTGVDLSRPSPLPAGSLAPGPNITTPSTHLPQETPTMFAETKKQIDALVDVARNNADPVAVADLFFDQTMTTLSDHDYSQLAAIIESDNFLSTIGIYNTQVKDYADWFGRMRTQLVERIKEADSGEN